MARQPQRHNGDRKKDLTQLVLEPGAQETPALTPHRDDPDKPGSEPRIGGNAGPTDAIPQSAHQFPALRALAVKALGFTGADVERLVREARQKARRQNRNLTFADIEAAIRGSRPVKPDALRWRLAIHEAGHAVVRHSLAIGSMISLSVDGDNGGYAIVSIGSLELPDEEHVVQVMAMLLAGRAAEELVFGNVTAGSGGSSTSDLAKATELALAMETTLGFSVDKPLLYREYRDSAQALVWNPELSGRVNARLELASSLAHDILVQRRKGIDALAAALMQRDTLEGSEVTAILRHALDLRPATSKPFIGKS